MLKEYTKLGKIESSLIEIDEVSDIFFGEVVKVQTRENNYLGQVVKIIGNTAVIQVFGDTTGVSGKNSKVSFSAKPFELPLSEEILGRKFNGVGEPIDGLGQIYSLNSYNINGRPINPVSRVYPRNFIQTGISSIDCLTTLIRGQKLPIFSGAGMPHNKLAAQIVRQAKIIGDENQDFSIVFAAIGVKHDEALYFENEFRNSGVLGNVVMYINYADDPIMERVIVPKCALTAAEFLAFEKGKHVLVIMTDITSYGEALREISSMREEVPSRKGYPGYMYSDLASIYERAGMIEDSEGSLTLIPILTMPNDDITHPIPDLTGYITEGQITLSRELMQQDIYPNINILPSLSRLMKDGIGEGFTRDDHQSIANQLFASYSKVQEVRDLAQIIGADDLSESDKKYLEFGNEFENKFIKQDLYDNRSIFDTLNLAWDLIRILPKEDLDRIDPELKNKYLK
ncbi:V-type ATP synthase subunit B [Miniphocaeibacter halophilus]|uniref:V-type ATP synthase subunit B n=1 Tax=Miniphocaeibacter halophilus TaxID=2931922 RepID=A0AC61MPZ1_9FIRM|nr:V-type ATP synthase subunit B [Miniphocaeibacter halophilus]QQK07363.1 V-type ATP synthase subunit B [Miniphocaeibacter halophilus]